MSAAGKSANFVLTVARGVAAARMLAIRRLNADHLAYAPLDATVDEIIEEMKVTQS